MKSHICRWLGIIVAVAALWLLAPLAALAEPTVPPAYQMTIDSLGAPNDIAVDASGNFYVAETSNNRITKFNAAGALLETWTAYAGQFSNGVPLWTEPWRSPRSVAVDAAGNVYVLHTVSSTDANVPDWEEVVVVLGTGVSQWAQWVADPDLPGTATHWWNLSVNGAGTQVDVTTCSNVAQFALSGGNLTLTASQIPIAPPGGNVSCIDPSCDVAIDATGSAYRATSDTGICKLNASLALVTSWGSNGCVAGGDPAAVSPRYRNVSVDAAGYIYAGDSANGKAEVFTPAGVSLGYWGSYGSPVVAASPDGSQILVADTPNNAVDLYASAAPIISAQSGNWSDAATWQGGVAPTSADSVEVRHLVTLSNHAEAQTLKVGPNGQVNVADKTLTLRKHLIDNSNTGATAITSSSPASGKVRFEGAAEQRITTDGGKADETKIGARVEAFHSLRLEKDASFEQDVKVNAAGRLDVYNKVAKFKKDLIDNTSASLEAITSSDANKAGKAVFIGAAQQKIKNETGDTKTDETKLGARVEAFQEIKLERNASFEQDLKVSASGKVDVYDKTAKLKKNLIDNTNTGAEAIKSSHLTAPGKAVFAGAGQQKIKKETGDAKTDETKIAVRIEALQELKLEKDASFEQDLKVSRPYGKLDVYDKVAKLKRDLIDNSSDGAEAITSSDVNKAGKAVFTGAGQQKIKKEPTDAKADETKIGARVEAMQELKLEKDASFEQDLKVSRPYGKLDVYDKTAKLKKDLIDNSSDGAEAITSSDVNKAGKAVFTGAGQQKIKKESADAKADETKIGARVEAMQKVVLERDARFKEHVTVADNGAYMGSFDIAGKKLAVEKDLIDNSTAAKAVEDSAGSSSAGGVSFEGDIEQRIKSDIAKSAETQIDAAAHFRKTASKVVVNKPAHLPKAKFGAAGMTGQQQVELQAQSRVQVDETVQQARIRQSAGTGSTITAMLRTVLSTITLALNNQVLVQRGSLEFLVEEGDPVVGTVGNLTFEVPLDVKARIDEPVDNEFTIENLSADGGGSITIYIDGDPMPPLAPGEEFDNLTMAGPAGAIEAGLETAHVTVSYLDGSPIPDTLTRSIAWGDGGTSDEGTLAGGVVTAGHVYATPGSYIVVATLFSGADSAQVSVVIVVVDTTPPVLHGVPADATVECDAVPGPASPTATDNGDPAPAIAYVEQRTGGSCADGYTLTRTWTAADDTGNWTSQSQVITVRDTTPPALSGVPADATVECDAVPAPASPSATDNCDLDPTIVYEQVRTDGACPSCYILTRTWTATDDCDNASSATQIITVQDTTPPALNGVPADVTVQCNLVPAPAQPMAIDNCDEQPAIVFTEARTDGACPSCYILTRTWSATDDCGNTTSASQTITVEDTTPPVLTVPDDIVLECATCDTGPDVTGQATAADTCDAAVEVTYADGAHQLTCGNTYWFERTWTATDDCGNTSSATQRITVQDTTAPALSITTPAEYDVQPYGTALSFSASDSCADGPAPRAFLQGATEGLPDGYTPPSPDGELSGYEPPVGVWTVTIVATDACGNTASETRQLVIYDPTAGFVTGGGWIASPAGAYAPDAALAGKATFGFVSKYKKGATVPTGETAFTFQVAGLAFYSNSYQWLVIAGARAQYKGVGQINGAGSYGFLLTAIDGQVKGGGGVDKFRIKIWDLATEAMVYDNQMGADDGVDLTTVLGGGSIVIHAK